MAETFAFTNFYGYYIENCLNIGPHAKLIISELLMILCNIQFNGLQYSPIFHKMCLNKLKKSLVIQFFFLSIFVIEK